MLSKFFLAVTMALIFSGVGLTVRAADSIEEVIVTGSYIKRDLLNSGLPAVIVTADDLEAFGLTGLSDVIGYLPFNSGSEFNADVFTQNLSTGTSNFNLRGLGLNSTLVLLNGRRQTVSGGVADDGSTFVDLNALVPLNAVERVEILKDGAAALYGTDAVAGVVNVITRTETDGLEIDGEFGTTTRSSQRDLALRGIYGLQKDRVRATIAVSYLRRSWLPSPERDYTQDKSFSGFGQPGAFILLEPSTIFPGLPSGLEGPQSIIDPDCAAAGGSPNESVVGSGLGTCTFDFAPYYHLVPRERRWLAFANASADIDDAEIFAEAGYAHSDLLRGTSPSFPILNLAMVPANNPGNVFQVPALFLGRPLGANAPVNLVTHTSETWRAVGGARGTVGDQWNWDLAATYSANRHVVKVGNALADRFDAALNGIGGPNNDLFFNPFGSAALSQPGDATHNDPAVINDFLSLATYDYRTSLFTVEGHVSGSLMDMPNGAVSIAVGGQVRRERINGDLDDQFNAENYLFFIGGPDFAGTRTVVAGFGELNIPVLETLDVQLALRHESYGSGLDSTDPKVALSWRPEGWMSMRASFGTSFRAPSVFQQFSSQTVLKNISDLVTGSLVFRGVRTVGTEYLKPERADVFNIGTTVRPSNGLSFGIDYWRFDYTDIIVKENAQAIIDANSFDPRVIREAGQILRVDTNYINAPSVETDGLDVAAAYEFNGVPGGVWALSVDVTYINKYVIQETSNAIARDVSGGRNFRTFARSLPKWKTTLGVNWSMGALGFSSYLKTVSGYFDDQSRVPIKSHITIDSQIRYSLDRPRVAETRSPTLALGVTNLFDKDPPSVSTNVGFDSKVHDPRGRVVYARIMATF